ncbi:MAG: MotA/TolQ/ExbB proton channel family protein [Balneolales bacterium]|nr:MotA/TolQ/ExbB proton channel family protein [Balneolales bacterium]
MKLSLTNILGVVFSIGILVFGITEITGTTSVLLSIPFLSDYTFLNIPSLFIVLGGILNAVFITYQPRYVGEAFSSIFLLFSQSRTSPKTLENDLGNLLVWNDQIKNDRVNALTSLEGEHSNSVTGYLFSLLSTNYSSEEINSFGSNHIEEHYFRQLVVVDVLRAMGAAAPSFGMFGTLFGLIVMLGQLENPSGMGPGLAAALITTLYGISLARFVFYPIAEKIKNVAQLNRFREYFLLEGIILINEKKSSFYIQDKMSTYLRRDFSKAIKEE